MVSRSSVFLSPAGGKLEAVTPDGEVLFAIAIPPGLVSAAPYVEFLPDGAEWDTGDLVVMEPASGYGVQTMGDAAFESGANPDFRPTPVSALELQMRQLMAQVQAQSDLVEARHRALDDVERIPSPALIEEIRQDDSASAKAAKPDDKKPDAATQ